MKNKTKITACAILIAMLVAILQPLCATETYEAATSYSNAKEFYESTALYGELYHAEAAYGRVYYATRAKLASSSTNTKYYTVGFDVTLSGNGHSVSFTVQREGGSMAQVGDSVKSGNYEYNLYVISEDKLYELASKADSANAAYVLSASTINVRMDAIMTTIEDGSKKGGIAENGYGGFTSWGKIYHLKDSTDLKKMKEIFSGHDFESYINIKEDLENYLLKVRYNVLGLNPTGSNPTLSNSSYTFNTSGLLQKSGTTYADESRTVKKITLLNTGTIGLSKTGYYLPSGNEWVTDNSRYFSSNSTHQSTTVDPTVGYQNHGITMYANWKPNTYTITYNANGGLGTVAASKLTYDTASNLRTNTFSRTGYYLPEGKEWIDANGNTYASGQSVKNLTTTNGAEITLYANWEPLVVMITTDKQSGTGGTDSFYEKYGVGFYSEANCTNGISSITIPSLTGYNFAGYYSSINGGGKLLLGGAGNIAVGNTFFLNNTTAYADWEAKQFTITFDKQGGTYGSDTVVATYDELFPNADAPVRDGYSFKGYYTGLYGKGTQIYNEFMSSDIRYQYANDITLYAYWKDDVLPEVSLNVSIDEWTNQEVTLTAEAMDFGSGLSSVQLYQINDDESLTLVNQALNLKGLKFKLLTFANTTEGIVRYKAVATDIAGNTAESYNVVYYDTTAPDGEMIEVDINGTTFYFDIDITDINTGD